MTSIKRLAWKPEFEQSEPRKMGELVADQVRDLKLNFQRQFEMIIHSNFALKPSSNKNIIAQPAAETNALNSIKRETRMHPAAILPSK